MTFFLFHWENKKQSEENFYKCQPHLTTQLHLTPHILPLSIYWRWIVSASHCKLCALSSSLFSSSPSLNLLSSVSIFFFPFLLDHFHQHAVISPIFTKKTKHNKTSLSPVLFSDCCHISPFIFIKKCLKNSSLYSPSLFLFLPLSLEPIALKLSSLPLNETSLFKVPNT